MHLRHRLALTALFSIPVVAVNGAVINTQWIGPSTGTWGTAANWDAGVIPDNGADTYNVAIAGATTVNVAGNFSIDSINNAGDLNFATNNQLRLNSNSVNNGSFVLNDGSSSTTNHASIAIDGNISLTGSGNTQFGSTFQNRLISHNNSATDSLTIGANQTVTTDGNSGRSGEIQVAAVNQGTITATNGQITLSSYDKTNTATIQATNNGTVVVSNVSVNNAGGTISTDGTGTIDMNSGTIDGGTVSIGNSLLMNNSTIRNANVSGGTLTVDGGTATLENSAVSNIAADVGHTEDLILRNTSPTNATIRLNDASSSSTNHADLQIDGNTQLNNGEVRFMSGLTNRVIETNATDVLTVGAGQVITTDGASRVGQVQVATVNQGDINADGGTIHLNTRDKTNTGTMRATNSGLLRADNISINNTGGTISTDASGEVNLNSSTVDGGNVTIGHSLLMGNATIRNANLSGGTLTVNGGTATLENTGVNNIEADVGHAEVLLLRNTSPVNANIRLSDLSSSSTNRAELDIDGNVVMTGGEVRFMTGLTNRINETNATDTLTLSASTTITTDGTSDRGEIGVTTINQGNINADDGVITLNTRDKSNAGTMQATNGGELFVYNVDINNAGGQINTDTTGTVTLSSANVDGGNLNIGNNLKMGHSSVSNATINGNTLTVNGGTATLTNTNATLQNALVGAAEVLALENTTVNSANIQLNDASSSSTNRADLRINGNSTLDGGQVQLQSIFSNRIIETNSTDVLTLQNGQSINTAGGTSNKGEVQVALVNNATINADAGTITLNTRDKTNNSLMQATGGGTLSVSAITINNAAGTLSTDASGTIALASGAVVDGGNINIGNELKVGNSTVRNANINGGTLTVDGGTATLENSSFSNATAVVGAAEALTLKGSNVNNVNVQLNDGSSSSTNRADLQVDGTASLDNGEVRFASIYSNRITETTSTDVLTLGSNHLVTTDSSAKGEIRTNVVNNGTIRADNSGTITLNSRDKTHNGSAEAANNGILNIQGIDISGTGGWSADGGRIITSSGANIATSGDINVSNGGELELGGASFQGKDLIIDNSGILDVNTGTLNLAGDFSFATTNTSHWQWSNNTSLVMNGGLGADTSSFANWAALEVGGNDIGTDPANHVGASAGFANGNFYIPELVIGASAHIFLQDLVDNGMRNGTFGSAEALYVDNLVFTDAIGQLNLNGLHLYYNNLTGNTSQIIDMQVASSAVPLPAPIWLLASLALWMGLGFRGKRH